MAKSTTAACCDGHFGKVAIAEGARHRFVATGLWGRNDIDIRARLDVLDPAAPVCRFFSFETTIAKLPIDRTSSLKQI
ncbi:hypothetical protein [Metarhizobium album]|uniref:hypothetical protein n=1 Tax=Metarhizobium album TaxID=2182425 RepID=UPI000FFEF09E|nr:hypothetical protein [Rhizobium album]